NDEARDTETFVDVGAADAEHAAQPAAQERADNADDHIEQDALLRIRPHDQAGEPADDAAHDQPDDDVHASTPLLVRDRFDPAPGKGAREQLSKGGREGG